MAKTSSTDIHSTHSTRPNDMGKPALPGPAPIVPNTNVGNTK